MVFPVNKFKNMSKHEFNIEIVTPLFSGGADGISAELRAPALKGMMRFWWRTIYGNDNIITMKKDEASIFGDTDHKSDVILSLNIPENCKSSKDDISNNRFSIENYLAYGTFDPKRAYYPSKTSFHLFLNCSARNNQKVLDSLQMIHQFGGIGSRCRNGYGSISIDKFLKHNPENLFRQKAEGQRKEFTSFSQNARLFVFKEQNTWNKALRVIGSAYKDAKLSLENGKNDARRQLVASPIDVKNGHPINNRHAKPYFLHVHKMENDKFRGQILFLPYNYYKKDKIGEYDKACRDMNNSIKQAENFAKEISASRGV